MVPPQDGDADNRLWALDFPAYQGKAEQERQLRALESFFGSTDAVTRIKHDEALKEASEAARKKLPDLRKRFNTGLKPGENLLLKAPFATPDGGREWMWVEVASWKADGSIPAVLQNDPFEIPNLKSGAHVEVKEKDIFDYILSTPDGTVEGNETGKIIEKMQEEEEQDSKSR